MASTAKKAPALIVSQVGEPDHATGAVDYRATVTGCGLPISLSFTLPHDGLVTNIGDGRFRYRAHRDRQAVADHATNADQHDTFAVTVSDNDGGTTDIPVRCLSRP